jgi:hypothetical protein
MKAAGKNPVLVAMLFLAGMAAGTARAQQAAQVPASVQANTAATMTSMGQLLSQINAMNSANAQLEQMNKAQNGGSGYGGLNPDGSLATGAAMGANGQWQPGMNSPFPGAYAQYMNGQGGGQNGQPAPPAPHYHYNSAKEGDYFSRVAMPARLFNNIPERKFDSVDKQAAALMQ